jgi:peptide deformylase
MTMMESEETRKPQAIVQGSAKDDPKPKEEEKKLTLKMVIHPNDMLRHPTVDLTEEQIKSPLIKTVVEEMIRLMYEHKGVGLAAQQAGIPNSIFVMDPVWGGENEEQSPLVIFNPKVTDVGEPMIELPSPGEGCLSIPYGFRSPVPRYSTFTLMWLDENADEQEFKFEGTEAIVAQHEYDHLQGILFPDRLSRLKQDMFKRKVAKIRRQYKKGYKRAKGGLEEKARIEKRMEKALIRKQDVYDAEAEKDSKAKGWGDVK